MSGCEAKVPALRFRMSLAESQRRGEGGRLSSTAENAARGDTRPPAPWVKKRLGEIFNERQSRSVHGELLSVSLNSGVFPASLNGRYDNSSIENGNYKCVFKGDIAYNSMRMWQGACGASAYDGLVSPAYTVVIPNEHAEGVFFEYAFKRDEMLFAFRQHSQGLTSDTWNLKFPLFSQIPIHSPSLPEQRLIGSFFRSLDALIAGREKALEKLEALKKSMLLKMFPRGDATVPEVRFKGFAGDWEKKRLGDFLEEREENNRGGIETEILSVMKDVGVIRYADKGNVGNRAKEDVTQYNIARKGDIVLNSMNVIIGSVGVAPCDGCISPAYYALRPMVNADASFWGYWFWRKESQCVISSLACGMMEIRRKISVEDLLSIETLVPTLPEQQKIGAYFRSLDALIAARREEVEKLKQMKKALLERMFI